MVSLTAATGRRHSITGTDMTQVRLQQVDAPPVHRSSAALDRGSAVRHRGRLVAARSYRPDAPPRLFVADPGRFELLADRSSPWSHRSTLVIALAGLSDVVHVVHPQARDVDLRDSAVRDSAVRDSGVRDSGRWDSRVGGPVTAPTLWDTVTQQVVSNDYATLEIDLATEFREWSSTGVELYPLDRQDEIDALDRWLGPAVNRGMYRAAGGQGSDRPGAKCRVPK